MNHGKSDNHWLGLDVSKGVFDAAFARGDQRFPSTPLRDLPWKRFPRTEAGVSALLEWITGVNPAGEALPRVVMEATGKYSVELAAWLTKADETLAPAIENPTQTKAFIDSLGQRNVTDGLAARGLAFYGVERRPAPYEPLTPERAELRELSRYRDALVQHRTAFKNRGKETCTTKLVMQLMKRQRAQFDRDIAKLEKEMKRVVNEAPELKADYDLLITIPGVGPVTAFVVLAELGDLRRFERARQLTAFAGVSPRIKESGTSVRGKTRLCKRGNGRVRQSLFLSSMAVLNTKGPNCLKSRYMHLRAEGKCGRAAVGVLMRKQLTIMRAVLISGKPYDPLWKTHGTVRENAPN